MIDRKTSSLANGALLYNWSSYNAGPFFAGGTEIIRRIFVTVRDADWREIPPRTAHADSVTSCRVNFTADYLSELIDFEWSGELEVDPENQRISFALKGCVRHDGSICRLGLIVLLPPHMVAGSRATVRADVLEKSAVIPEGLGPQPIVGDWPAALTEPFGGIRIEPNGGGWLDLSFAGDLFEIEDQRNWGDASYKIYCTPLADGFPRPVQAGDVVAHRVDISYQVPERARERPAQWGLPKIFPAIGVSMNGGGAARAFVATTASHLPVDATGPFLEIRIAEEDLADGRMLAASLGPVAHHVARLILVGNEAGPPPQAAVSLLRSVMRDAGIEAPLLLDAGGYFVEFNRETPLPEGGDGLAWPLAPTVHSGDLDTVYENVAPCGPMAEHARRKGADRLAIAPLAWNYPPVSPIETEPRRVLLWLSAVLIDAAAAGIDSVTLDETLFRHLAGDAETGDMLDSLILLSSAVVRPIISNVDGLAAMAIYRGAVPELLLVNTRRDESVLDVPGACERIALAPHSLQFREVAATEADATA